jgi:lysophospholipase L1-like esterase
MNDDPSKLVKQSRWRWRLAALLLVGTVALGAALGYLRYWIFKPIGSGPAGPAVARDHFAQPWSQRKVLLVGLGDSVTAGFGARRGYGYFDRLAVNPEDEFPDLSGICLKAVLPNLETLNLAVSGSTSLDHVEHVRERLKTQDPDTFGLVVMTSGGNDLIHSYGQRPPREGAMYGATLTQAKPWIERFEQRFGETLDRITERFPGGCRIFVADIYDPTDATGDAPAAGLPHWPDGLAIHAAYNEAIRRVAGKRPHVHVVPMYQQFLGHGIHCRQFWHPHYRSDDPYYWYASNLEDPNERGYDAIRRLFLLEIVKVVQQSLKESSPSEPGRVAPHDR